jgi:hypothetical protein
MFIVEADFAHCEVAAEAEELIEHRTLSTSKYGTNTCTFLKH